MLTLVVADRDAIGAVEQDVARHQDRVREQAGGDELAPIRLVLELRHPAELAVARDGREQPTRLGVRRHVALRKDGRAVRVEPGGDQYREEVERAVVQVARVVLDGDRVQVDDAEERLAELLCLRELAEAADVVAEVLVARRLDAREDPHTAPFARFATERTRRTLRSPRCIDAPQRQKRQWRSIPGIASLLASLTRSVKEAAQKRPG